MVMDFDDLEADRTTVMPAFSPGTFFAGRFQIDHDLGTGGMGNVYAATDLRANRRVALKVLKKAALQADAGARFEREVAILRSAHHPCVVGIHDYGQSDDGTAWLAMELLEGETLRSRVQRLGPMRAEDLVAILSAACGALTQAHAHGVVHRDLKPDNLFLPASGEPPVKILDFGLSLAKGSKKLTKTGTILGTPRYMAPEQIASAHTSGGQADVYALGVIVYEALSGHSPFVASDHGQLLGAILQGRIEPLGHKRPDLSPEVVRTVELAMAREADERFRTPDEFAATFERAVRGLPIAEHVLHRGRSSSSPELEGLRFSSPSSPGGPPAPRPLPATPTPVVVPARDGNVVRDVLRYVGLALAALALVALGAFVSYSLLR